MSKRKPLDISELYDELKKLKGSYVLGLDINDLHPVNTEYGYAAGDLMIAEAFARLEREIGENMLLFRIGGDEFAILTGYTSLSGAEALARKITAHNGETAKTAAGEIPVSLRVGISRLPEHALSYRKALDLMYSAMDRAHEAADHIGICD